VTFRDPSVSQEKKNCIESELAVREQLVKQWYELFSRRPHALHQRNDDGRTIELHRVAYLSGNGARCASHEGGLFTRGCDPGFIFAIDYDAADIRRAGFVNVTTDEIKGRCFTARRTSSRRRAKPKCKRPATF